MSETVPFSEAKSHLSELADRVETTNERVLVTRNGRPSFVLVNPDDLDSQEEALERYRDMGTGAPPTVLTSAKHSWS